MDYPDVKKDSMIEILVCARKDEIDASSDNRTENLTYVVLVPGSNFVTQRALHLTSQVVLLTSIAIDSRSAFNLQPAHKHGRSNRRRPRYRAHRTNATLRRRLEQS